MIHINKKEMKKILLPTDFSSNARRAYQYAFNFFMDEDCTFYLLHAFLPPNVPAGAFVNIDDVMEGDAEESLKKELEVFNIEGLAYQPKIETITMKGDVESAVEQVVKEKGIDVVVMGSKGASGIKELLVGSNAAGVIQKSICPTILIPEKALLKAPVKIVFATDYRKISDLQLLNPLKFTAKKFNAIIQVLHVYDKEEDQHIDEERKQELDEYLGGIEHSFHNIHSENIVQGIDDFIHAQAAGMLALVPKRNNFFERIFHKSVTNKMAMHVDIPLLAMHDL